SSPWINLIAQFQLQGRKNRKRIRMAPADVTRLREESPGKGTQTGRNKRVRTDLSDIALDIDHLVCCAQSDLASDIQGEPLTLNGKPAADLTSVELVRGRKQVVEVGNVAENQICRRIVNLQGLS